VSGNGLMALGPESEERHRVAAAEPTHCEGGGVCISYCRGRGGGGGSEHVTVKRHSWRGVEVHVGI